MISHVANRQNTMAQLREASAQKIAAHRAEVDIARRKPEDWQANPYKSGVYEMQVGGKKYTLETSPGGLQGKSLTVTEHREDTKFNLADRNVHTSFALNIRASKLATAIKKIRTDQTSRATEELKDPNRIAEIATVAPEKITSSELVRKGNELKARVGIKDTDGHVISFSISASRIPDSTGYQSKNHYLVEAGARSQFGSLAAVVIRGKIAESIYKAMHEARNKQ